MNSWTSNAEVKREFGSLLRRARENQGLTIADVSEKTRIPSRYIQLLEEEAFDKLTQPFYVRNYINNLSKFYGIDPRPLQAFYQSLSGYTPPNLSPDVYTAPEPAPAKPKAAPAAPAAPATPAPQTKPAGGTRPEPGTVAGPGPRTIPRRPQPTGITVNKSGGNSRELSTAGWLFGGILTIAIVIGLAIYLPPLFTGGTQPPKNNKPAGDNPPAKTAVAAPATAEKTTAMGTDVMERFIYPQPFSPTTIKIPDAKPASTTGGRSSR
jgi:transcriptional regulator with XRE-family HTH domain